MDVGPDTERLQWIASNLHIITKSGTRVRLVPNSVQLMLHMAMRQQRVRGLPVRLEILKARQEGCSTWIEAEGFYEAFHRPNWRAMAVSVDADSTDHIFGITKLFDEDLPVGLRKEKDNTNRKEIKYSAPHRSSFLAQTAGKFSLGRSFTIQYLHCCVAEGTLIVTKDGRAVPIEQCVLGDPVQTHTGAASTISVWSMQQKRCKKFTFRGMRTLPLVATPEHKVWTREGWKPLGDMVLGECIGYPVKQIATTIRRLPFAQPAIRRPQNGGSAERVPATTKLDYALGRIVGFYLAEGTTSRQHKSPHQFCRTVFAVHEKEVPMVLEWLQPLRGLFCSARVRQPAKDSKTRCVDVHGKSLAAFITNLVGRTDEKHGPENWWRMPAEFIRGTVDGYLAGDGHFSKDPNSRTIRTSSIRPAITLYMRDAIASLGLGWPSIEFRDGGIRHGRNEKPQHTLTVTGDAVIAIAQGLGKPYTPRVRPTRGIAQPCRIEDGFAWIPLQSVSDAGERWVYDLEVAHDDHSYCVLQGAVSNSESAFWENAETQMSSLEEAVPMKPETTIIQETTANGQGGYFYQSWKENLNRRRGHPENFSGYIPVFFPWYIFPDYSIQPPSETIFTKEERAIRDQFQLTDGQLYWRRMKIESKNGDVSLFCQEYPATWQEGFQVSGNPVFSAEIVAGQSAFQKSSFQHVVLDEMGGSVEVVSCDEELNCWRVSSPPKDAHDYVIGIDTMEGRLSDVQNVRSNLDYDGMVVLDRNTGEVAALYHGRGDQRQLACQAFAAAIWYNEAFVAPEIPQGMVLLDYFKSRNYPYLYNRQRHEDRETETASEVLGWRTTAITRKWLVDDMVVACKEQSIKLIFPELIDEMRSFVRDKTGRPGHLPGEHDDLLFAGMIALQCHKRVPLSNKPYAYSHTGEGVKPVVDDNDLARTGAIDHWRPEEEDETDDFWSDHTD